ncbi:response regulator transcription factor [Flavisolibacter ginsengisoli]|jgi:DNA-binding response OmpR family regulator|uniref:DNA-binding response regulator, OmpR family, contains REC and winged-helix (WHTH) domain n=1 Tax=Flavisolibacter ginsengisoli DSM 18119 TaxID=1121884 RepID=A0A1M4UBY0_9BACT|nr:response regulator transcription factor [Flavisolibacter ginsengisoli]SHE54225.1 DNA-binding response regulator, OmpR family, contains REC and winged-helix (wHTH) domain [Flavisolibacter ginsengisoli DSM 18119]
MKILIVEDEKELSQSICAYLNNEQYFCESAYDYHAALEKILLYDYACVILDISLPGGNGMDLLKQLRSIDKMDGVIIVSARNSIDDKVKGLLAGADDYLTKPFHLPELAARVSAIIRRKSFDGKNLVRFDNIELDLHEKVLKVNNIPVELTKKEYELLLYFISNKNRVVAKNAIAIHLWGDSFDISDNYDFIYTHIKNLRRKLVQSGALDYIKSVYGMGYKFSMS